jgi:hypothetical protein
MLFYTLLCLTNFLYLIPSLTLSEIPFALPVASCVLAILEYLVTLRMLGTVKAYSPKLTLKKLVLGQQYERGCRQNYFCILHS